MQATMIVGRRADTARKWFNTPPGVAALTLIAYGGFILMQLIGYGGDITRFVIAGPQFIPPQVGATVGLSVLSHGTGNDGQFYYLLALNPFSPHVALPGAHYDWPSYRAQRILYPLVVWALSLGGRPALVPLMLPLVNLAAVVAVGWVSATLARRFGAQPLWGLLLAFYPGLLVSLAADIGDPLAMALALGGLLALVNRRWGWASALFSLAALSRETTTLIPLALAIAALLARVTPLPALRLPAIRLIAREDRRAGFLAGVIPCIAACAWQLETLVVWGHLGVGSGESNISYPLLGLFISLLVWTKLSYPLLQIVLYGNVFYLLGIVIIAWQAQRWGKKAPGAIALAWALNVALAVFFSLNIWDFYYFLRAALELGLLSLLLAFGASRRARSVALGATLAAWVITAIAMSTWAASAF